ncbi:thiamine phosphate synthase [Hydrogenimonas sp.]
MILRYAITDPSHYTSEPSTLKERLVSTLSSMPIDLICLRDKQARNYPELARSFLSLRSDFPDVKFLLHTDVELAFTLEADGIHLPSHAFEKIGTARERKLWTIVSTHTLHEAEKAEREGADAVTFSPVFDTPGKGPARGLEKLKEIRDKISIKLFALGGIVTEEQIEAVERVGADGFASIRYFVPPMTPCKEI